MQKTFEITISGQVQGVGFRPFVYSLSKQFQLRGSVCNNQDGVLIHINASEEKATNFLVQLLENAPSISIIQSHKISEIPFQEFDGFKIIPSEAKHQTNIPLTPDFSICVMATTEGDDKPKKYPKMFLTSDMMVVSKADLLPYVPFSVEAVIKDAREVNHEIEVLQVSSTNGEGIDAWCDWLLEKIERKKG